MKEISIKHKHVLENDRPTIAALIGSMSSEYHDGIVRGAAYVAAERGYNFIGFSGGPVNTPAPFSLARDKVFDFVDLNRVSGILSPFSSLVRYLDEKETYKFINQFAAIPIVNIGSTIEGRTNILTEYESGFREIFEHFYHIHGYRKILLMRGPEHHASSQQRAAIYRALCHEYKLPYSDDLVIYSDLNRDSAKKSMESFLRKRSCTFDAIIALNDFQALGIIDILSEKGIRVPEDVAVVGSMNSLEGSFSTPSLTSIKEPSFELGQAAAIELIEQIEGKKPLKEIIKKTSLVIRQSCGCVSSEQLHLEQLSSDLQLEISDSFESVILEELRRDTEQIAAEYKGGILKNDLFRILDIFRDSLFRKDHTYFLEELKSRLEKSQKSEDIMLWLAIMAKLQIFLLRIFDRDPSSRLLILLSMELIKLRNDYGLIAINYRRYETDFYLNNFRAIENNLNKTFNLTSLKPYIVEILYASEFYISIFHNDEDQNKMASNLFSVHNGHFIELDLKEYNAINLLPDNIEAFKDPYSLIVFPLSFRNKQIGHMTVSLSDRKGIAYENLRATISSALKNEILIQDLKSAEERFSDIAHSTSNWLC